MKWALILTLALAGCESDIIATKARREQNMYLMKACVEKGGFPQVDRFSDFVTCRWPEKKVD